MNLKRVGTALVAAAVLAAIVASSASAAAVTPEKTHWIVGGVKMASGGSEHVGCRVGEHEFSGTRKATLELNGSLGAAKTPVVLSATGIDCINNAGTGENGTATITQNSNMAEDEGRLRFTNVKVVSPPNCQIKGISVADPVGTVTTNALKSQLQEETVGGVTTVFDKFEPAVSGGAFVEIKIEKSGTELACAVSGSYSAKGTAFGEAVKDVAGTEKAPTGFEAAGQALTFSKGIEETAGGTLTLGGNAASITGRVVNELYTTESPPKPNGKKWGAVE